VICVNNFTFGMTGGQVAATTPFGARSSTTAAGNSESPFNLPLLAYAAGASFIARWTILHARDLADTIHEALMRRGFSFIEVLSPCPVNFGRANKEKTLETLQKYQKNTIVKNGAGLEEMEIDFTRGVVLGKFIDIDKPTCDEVYRRMAWPPEEPKQEKEVV
jgi:2-oxoglutarate ferredoxin oxidoreductase subunit beta